MKQLLALISLFLIVPLPMQAMVRRPIGKPRAPETNRPALKVPKRSIVDVRHLKNVHTVIKPEFAHLSPLVGASYINSDFLKKVYQFAPNHPTTRLLNDPKLGLFHLQNTQFRDTQSLGMPGRSLNPELVGEIMAHLQAGQLNMPEIQNELIKKWKKTHSDKLKTSISSEKLSQFLKLVQDSKNAESEPEQSRLFIPHTTEAILTGFLYRKATTKNELVTYLNTLNKHLPLLEKSIDDNILTDNYTSEELKKRVIKLKKLDGDKQLKSIEKDFEGIACALLHQDSSKEIPPQVLQSSYGYQGQREVANCSECALHDLCNMLLADTSTGLFNLKLLPSTVLPLKELHDFYKHYPSYSTVNDSKTGQAWMNLLSNRESIIYVQNNYEVECFADNILNLLTIMFNVKAKSWKEFAELLSTKHRAISCKEKIKDKIHTISFSIGDFEGNLVIESGQHTYLNCPTRKNNTEDLFSINTGKSLLKADKSIYLNTLVPMIYSSLYYIKEEDPLSRYLLGLFSGISEDQSNMGYILYKVSSIAKEKPALRETLAKLVKKLPHDDHDLMSVAFEAIVKSKAYETSEECLHFIKTYPHSAPVECLNGLLECCIKNPHIGIDQIKLLLNRGAEISSNILYAAIKEKKCDLEIMQELMNKERIFAIEDVLRGPFTANLLALALSESRHDVANLLLKIISSPDCSDFLKLSFLKNRCLGKTPLEYALLGLAERSTNQEEQSSYLEIVKKLIELGALADTISASEAASAWISATTELLVFSEKDNLEDVVELIRIFCDNTIDVNIANYIGDTTFDKVITCLKHTTSVEKKSYCYQIIELLLAAGAHPKYLEPSGKFIHALDLAIEMKDKKLEDLIRSNIEKADKAKKDQNSKKKKWSQRAFKTNNLKSQESIEKLCDK